MDEQDARSILVVAEVKGQLLLAFEAALRDFSYRIITVPPDVDAFADITEPTSGLLLHAEEGFLEQHHILHFIKDRIIALDMPAFILGSRKHVDEVKTVIPPHVFLHEFVRPINVHVNVLAEKMHNRILQHSVKKKILLVDDSGAWLRSIKGWLEEKYNVFLANSGAMAIKYLALNQPDLVLLDYAMPVVDGKQVLEMIRTETDFAQIPVMFLTNKNDADSIIQVKELKPEGYLLKTMSPAQILKAVDDFFALQKGLSV